MEVTAHLRDACPAPHLLSQGGTDAKESFTKRRSPSSLPCRRPSGPLNVAASDPVLAYRPVGIGSPRTAGPPTWRVLERLAMGHAQQPHRQSLPMRAQGSRRRSCPPINRSRLEPFFAAAWWVQPVAVERAVAGRPIGAVLAADRS
jgi:hypothetical protein